MLGASHLHTVNVNNSYGACLLGLGEFRQARELFLQSLAGLKGDDGIKVGLVRVAVQINLGHSYAELGEWEALQSSLVDVRKTGVKLLKADSDALGEVELLEGRLAAAQGDIKIAKSRLESGIGNLSRKNPPDYWLIKIGKRELAKVAALHPQGG